MADFAVKVDRMRPGGGNALAFFNLLLGYKTDNGFVPLLEARDFVLKRKNDGSSLYYQAPSKPRIRQGEHVVDDRGYKVYDNIIDLYGEKGAGQDKEKWSPTKAAFALRKHILDQAEKALKAMNEENMGRGSAEKRESSRPTQVTSQIESSGGDVSDLLGGDFGGDNNSDYDIPF